MPKRSTIGVIGCGYAAEVHLAAIGVLGGAEVAALADPDVDRMNTLARRHGISRCHTHWRELVEDPSIDIIAVLTPPTWHREMTLAAVRSGKHVMVEKPLVVDLDEADQLIQETGDSPVGIMIGYNLRFHQQVQQLR
ncbi:MAG: Gfo/Idh/MocA family oxidoreductase, partial [Burkholderiales bacterium]|nr:Gfo/Idh/MocA family oxidoreductase [Burkholderiales bacterium]